MDYGFANKELVSKSMLQQVYSHAVNNSIMGYENTNPVKGAVAPGVGQYLAHSKPGRKVRKGLRPLAAKMLKNPKTTQFSRKLLTKI